MIFAQLDENNIVINCIIADYDFVQSLEGTWIGREESAKDAPSIGWTYDASVNNFFPVKPHHDSVLDTETWRWVPPVPEPTDDNFYTWHQPTHEWIKTERPNG